MQRAGAADTAGTGSCLYSHSRQCPVPTQAETARFCHPLPLAEEPGHLACKGAAEFWASAAPASTLPACLPPAVPQGPGRARGTSRVPPGGGGGGSQAPDSPHSLCLCQNFAFAVTPSLNVQPPVQQPRGALLDGDAPSWVLRSPVRCQAPAPAPGRLRPGGRLLCLQVFWLPWPQHLCCSQKAGDDVIQGAGRCAPILPACTSAEPAQDRGPGGAAEPPSAGSPAAESPWPRQDGGRCAARRGAEHRASLCPHPCPHPVPGQEFHTRGKRERAGCEPCRRSASADGAGRGVSDYW